MNSLLTFPKRARGLLGVLIGMAVLCIASTASAQDVAKPSADEVIDKLQAYYASMKDYQARFTQTYTDVAEGEEKKSGGRVFFKKPGKMRWDYIDRSKGKQEQLLKALVSDGTSFSIYEAEFNQYYRQCLKDSQLPTALRFLMGTGDLKQEFSIKLLKAKEKGTFRLALKPKKSTGQYKKLIFVVNRDDFSARETIIYDPYGNTNQIVFEKAKLNKNLPDEGFVFTPTDDMNVLNNSKNLKCK